MERKNIKMIYFTTYNGIITRKQINSCIENKHVNVNGRMEKKTTNIHIQRSVFKCQNTDIQLQHIGLAIYS